jgi:RNA polymerase sigma-70 factor (sigma-E family)
MGIPVPAKRCYRARDGRAMTVEALFERKYRPLCRLAHLMLGDRDAAEQVVMDAFVEIFSRWGTIRDVSKADAYLRRSVVNGARSTLRRRSLEARANALFHGRSQSTVPPALEASPDPAVLQAVRQLPHRQRAAVVLFFYEDLSEAQIAEILGCTVGTVKSQLSKARAKLACCLQQGRDEEEQLPW